MLGERNVYSLEATFDSGLSSSSRVRLTNRIYVQTVTAIWLVSSFLWFSRWCLRSFSLSLSRIATIQRLRLVPRLPLHEGKANRSTRVIDLFIVLTVTVANNMEPYYGHDYYDRPNGYGYNGYPGYYYGRPQGLLGTVGNVLDGLLGLREGEKKQPTDGVVAPADAQPPAAAVDSAPASEIASGGDGVVFQ
ncbi:hypothetical protein OUZ56_006154 [Daphnia magna]|uniref:Uncharacterized protein n=1 Tax=Daphnia magna TaxID=35525 RepID=A0ABQ9YV03_9CRUS|nr:hypothetical protein OUZ56_006154 [Daphnia magna]